MAAQIASFVQNADSDTTESPTTKHHTNSNPISQPISTSNTISIPVEPSPAASPSPSEVHLHKTVHEVHVHTTVHRECTPDRFDASRSSSSNSRVSPENNEAYPIRTSRTPDSAKSSSPTEGLRATDQVEKQINTLERSGPSKIVIREPTQDEVVEPLNHQQSTITPTITELNIQEVTVPMVEIVRTISGPEVQQVESLKITESIEDLPTKSETSTVASTAADRERYKIRFVALKPAASETRETEIQPNSSWLHTKSVSKGDDATIDNPDSENVIVRSHAKHPSVPTKRRRSVKDIIASINKSQSLLRINQDPNAASAAKDKRLTSLEQFEQPTARPIKSVSNESILRNLTELQASEQQIRQTISDMERSRSDTNNNNDLTVNHLDDHDALVHIPVMAERFSEFSEEFKKCNVNGRANTSSPLVVQRRDKSERTDWNPLPKPRRSRNLTQEVEASVSAKSDRWNELRRNIIALPYIVGRNTHRFI